LKYAYDLLYQDYKKFIKPERYEIEVQQAIGNNNFISHNFHMKGPRIIVVKNDNDRIYVSEGTFLKKGWIFWECYDFKATVDFTDQFGPIFAVERKFKGQPDGKTVINLPTTGGVIETASAYDQTLPGMKCYKGDSWCFITVPKDDWFFIRIRPL
jgi:hypothetical protein